MKRFFTSFTLIFAFFFASNAQTVIHSENFSGSPAITWTQVDVTDPTDVWLLTSGYAQINGFGGTVDDLDWLISPSINMDNSTNETFSFKTKNQYSGATTGPAPTINLELKYTTNYTGNPETTTWTSITFPASVLASNTTTTTLTAQTAHGPIDISSISGTNVRFAFRYYGTPTASKLWQIDDIVINGTTPCTAPTTQASALNATATASTANLTWTAGDGNKTIILINNTNSFTAPVNGTTYTANAAYSGSGQQVVYIGNGTSMTVSGLAATTTYYIQAYNMSDCSAPVTYITTAPSVFNVTTLSGGGGGGEPAGYYDAAAGLTCSAKKNALETIITTGYNSQTYTALWTDYLTTDDRLNDAGTKTIVWDMYTDNPNGSECEFTFVTDQDNGTQGTAECQKFNREHSFPKSWFGGSTSQFTPGTDLFIVYPTDKKVNSVRGNQPYGETSSPSWTSVNGSKYGPSSVSGISGDIFEPIDAYKGDFARSYFYVATRYGVNIGGWQNNGTGEANIALDGTRWPAYEIPYLKMLIKWHTNDPVSQKEIDRNNAVYAIQGNRNPYIDHPDYVYDVWLNNCGLAIPVTLKSFSGVYKNQNVHLDWSVSNEYAFNNYEIERSTDGLKFTTINTVKAQGLNLYSMDDAVLDNKITRLYYRLKMVNQDGTYDYSRVVSVQLPQQKSNLLFYPNPAKTDITIQVTNESATDFNVNITDVFGKVWLQKNISTTYGTTNNLDISILPAGNYFLTTNVKGQVEYQRLTVVR